MQGFVPQAFTEVVVASQSGVPLPCPPERPGHHRILLGVHDVGVRQVAEVLAVVTRRIKPAATHVARRSIIQARSLRVRLVPDPRRPLALDVEQEI